MSFRYDDRRGDRDRDRELPLRDRDIRERDDPRDRERDRDRDRERDRDRDRDRDRGRDIDRRRDDLPPRDRDRDLRDRERDREPLRDRDRRMGDRDSLRDRDRPIGRERERERERERPRETPAPVIPPEDKVDRQKICPLLLRVFTKEGAHHKQEEFAVRGEEPKDELAIYTWKDATLRELTDLIKGAKAAARAKDARLSFALIYPDKTGTFVPRTVGEVQANGRRGPDDYKTLLGLKFETGDYLDVAILAGPVATPASERDRESR